MFLCFCCCNLFVFVVVFDLFSLFVFLQVFGIRQCIDEDRQYEKPREIPDKLSMRTDIINSMMAEKSAKTVGPGAAVPMKLFAAAWELEKTAPNCIPRYNSSASMSSALKENVDQWGFRKIFLTFPRNSWNFLDYLCSGINNVIR